MAPEVPGHKAVRGRPFVTILRYLRPYWRAYAGGAVLSVIYIGAGLLTPLVVRAAVQEFEAESMTRGLLFWYFGALVAIGIVTGLSRFGERMTIIRASRKFEYDLRNDYFRRVQTLSQDFFHRTATGDIVARAGNDLNFVRMFAGPGIMGTMDMIRLPYTLAIMLYLSVDLTLIALTPLPFATVFVYLFLMYMYRQSLVVQERFSSLTSRAQENLAGARVVKAYGAGDQETENFRGESRRYMTENMKLALATSLIWPMIGLIVGLTTLLVLWQGGQMVMGDDTTRRITWDGAWFAVRTVEFTLGDLTGFVVALIMLAWPLVEFGWVMTLYQRGSVGMNRIAEILNTQPTIRDTGETRTDIDELRGAVAFEGVTFGYGTEPVLKDVSFRIAPGQTCAIVGPTGSGKSTIVSLLVREYDPWEGTVRLDGEDARRIPLRVLRDAIGFVPQDPFLFSDTVRANLTVGRPDATEADMDAACVVAQFEETLRELPDGYDTLLGERGVNLSGGQKQRLTIARALIREPVILLLDDALSSVDTHTEEEILQRLGGFMEDRTSVIIAHRVSTIRHADQILVLDNDRIAERGAHEELLAMGGIYARMYERQLLEEELEVE